MKIKKVAVLSGSIAKYNAIDMFAKLLANGLQELLYCDSGQCNLLRIGSEALSGEYLNEISKDYDLLISINGTYINRDGELRNSLIKNDTMCLSLLIDNPYFHTTRLKCPVKRQIISCFDRKHIKFVNRFYKRAGKTFFLPHGAVLPDVPVKHWEEKEGGVAFFGSYTPPEQSLELLSEAAPETQEVLISVVDEVWSGRIDTLEDSIEHVFGCKGYYETDEQLSDLIAEASFLETYIRNERRAILINTLLDAGISVNVYGEGWNRLESKSHGNLIIHKPLAMQSCSNEMTKYKIVLSDMTLLTNGSHERIFTIPSAGSVLVTDSNPYIDSIYEDGKDYFKYSWNKMDELPELITSILSQEMNTTDVIKRSREKVLKNHLWKNRAREILDYTESIDI